MHKPRLCDSQNTPFWVCLNYTMRDASRPLAVAFGCSALWLRLVLEETQTLMGGDASRVGKRGSYYLVAFVFSSFLYPDAGRVAPIRACVLW